MTEKLTESAIEDLTIKLFEKLGYQFIYAQPIAPDSDMPERERFEDVVLLKRLRNAVGRINPSLSYDVPQ
jgi:type I restriction enzyme R subunit